MKFIRLFIITGMMLFCSIAAWAENSVTPVKVPVIKIQEPVYTFPAAIEGEYVLHDFIVKNTGDADLQIVRVTST